VRYVHHKDGDPANNNRENLEVRDTETWENYDGPMFLASTLTQLEDAAYWIGQGVGTEAHYETRKRLRQAISNRIRYLTIALERAIPEIKDEDDGYFIEQLRETLNRRLEHEHDCFVNQCLLYE
jgi:hypothetical protein